MTKTRCSSLIVAFFASALLTSIAAGDDFVRTIWRANTFTASAQESPALAVAPNGDLTVAWSSRRQQQGRYGVYAQRFDSRGVAIGQETCLALWGKSHQTAPDLACDADGGLWAVWQSFRQDGHSSAVIARRFDARMRGADEILVNQDTRGDQSAPSVAVAPDGAALVVWTSTPSPRDATHIRGRLFSPTGQPLCDEFHVTADPTAVESVPSAAATPDGRFWVAYAVASTGGEPLGIRVRAVLRDGPTGTALNVCGAPRLSQVEPAIAATADGFVVTWHDAESDGDAYGVLARRFDAAGQPLGDAFVVNTTARGTQAGAAVAASAKGGFVVAWNSRDGDERGVFAQRFNADGNRVGGEFRLTNATEGDQALTNASGAHRLALRDDGAICAAWSGRADEADKSGVAIASVSPQPRDPALPIGIVAGMTPAAGRSEQAAAQPHEPPTFDPDMVQQRDEGDIAMADFGFTAIVNTGWTPPDPHMAVGPNHVVVMTNGAIAAFNKLGVLQFQDEIEDSFGFWGSVGATGFVFDPEVLYDELSGRFFAMAAEGFEPAGTSHVLIAVSDDSDPNGTWYKYRFSTAALAGDLFDSPNIAVDANVLYVTGDGFGISSNYPVYTFDKASLLAGLPPVVQKSTTLSTSTQSAGMPPVSFDNPPALYMIEHKEAGSNTSVRLIALTNPLTTITFTTFTLTVPAYSPPGDPVQMGTTNRPETFDARFWSVAYRDGYLWATHHINDPVKVRWYQIKMNGWPTSGMNPALVQSGDVVPASGVYGFFSSITADANQNAALCFSRSSSSSFIGMATAFRLATDAAGTFRTPVTQQTSTAAYTFAARWGDYSAIEVDPADGRSFWAHHEYAIGNNWRTWVAHVIPPFSLGDMNCDGAVNGFDVDPYVLALTDPDAYEATYPDCNILLGDINGDGSVNGFDVDGFVGLLGG